LHRPQQQQQQRRRRRQKYSFSPGKNWNALGAYVASDAAQISLERLQVLRMVLKKRNT